MVSVNSTSENIVSSGEISLKEINKEKVFFIVLCTATQSFAATIQNCIYHIQNSAG